VRRGAIAKKRLGSDANWFTAAQVAAFLGVSQEYFRRDLRPFLPAEHIHEVKRGKAKRVWFYGPGVVQLRVQKAVDDALRATDGDPLLAGGSTPALERYRLARAKIEELKLERELGRWIERSVIHQGLAGIAAKIRAAGERLQKRFGPEAQNIIDEALDEAAREIEAFVGAEEVEDGNGPDASKGS